MERPYFYVNLDALKSYTALLTPTAPEDAPQPPAADVLQQAWQSLLDAGVVVYGKNPERFDAKIIVGPNNVTVNPGPNETEWDHSQLPPLEGLIHTLVFALVAMLNSPSSPSSAHGWPWPKG